MISATQDINDVKSQEHSGTADGEGSCADQYWRQRRQEQREKNWSLGKLETWGLKKLCGATENPTEPQKVNTLLGFAGDNTLVQQGNTLYIFKIYS